MKNLTRKHCIICLSLLISILLTGSGLQGTVLCHDEGGHTTIGIVDSNCCSNCSAKISEGPSQMRSADSAETEPSSKHDCGACVVIPLSIGFAAVARESNRVAHPTLATSGIIAFAAVDSPDSTEYRSVSEFFVPPPYFAPLQSIVLLI